MPTSLKFNIMLVPLLLMIPLVLATPSPAYIATFIDNSTSQQLNDRDVIATISFPGSPSYQACLPFHDNDLCTVFFLDNSAWNGNAKLWAYDHSCTQLGSAASVSRVSLAASFLGWPFLTRLSDPIGVYVERDWDATDGHVLSAAQGVMLSYHGSPVPALDKNLHGLAAWWGTKGADGSDWWFWRTSFPC